MSDPRVRLRIDARGAVPKIGLQVGTSVDLDIPVLVSAQEARDIAESIFGAIYICETLASAFASASISFHTNKRDPNFETVRLSGDVRDRKPIDNFWRDWGHSLDATAITSLCFSLRKQMNSTFESRVTTRSTCSLCQS